MARAGIDAPLIVSWGRLEYEKGFQTLIAAVARLVARHPALRCVLVGRGTYSEELRGVARGLGVQQAVQFAGFVSDEELVRLLNEATCAVIPSLYEPFGIVALEALSAGAPLIAAESGGLREVLGGTDAGLLFPPGNADALAAAFDRMTTEPGLVAKSQAAGTELVATKYSWDAIAASTIDVYLDAGAKPPTTKPKKAGKGK